MATAELRHLVLVEDNQNDVELTLAALSQYRVINEIIVLRDGQECLDYLTRTGAYAERTGGNPAVVLLDIKLPKVDGLQVLARIKSDPVLKVVPIVMLTASKEEQDVARSYNLGVNAYVVKPVDFRDFVSALKELGLFWAVVNNPPPGCAGELP